MSGVVIIRKPYDSVVAVPKCFKVLTEKEYRLLRDSKGNCSYIEVGEKNISDYVESFKTGCSLKSILDRCQLMPVRDKIAYLQQNIDGVSADLSNMPTDGTEAFILINKVKSVCPDFTVRLANGESFESIVSDFIQKPEGVGETDVSSTVNSNSEVDNNG